MGKYFLREGLGAPKISKTLGALRICTPTLPPAPPLALNRTPTLKMVQNRLPKIEIVLLVHRVGRRVCVVLIRTPSSLSLHVFITLKV